MKQSLNPFLEDLRLGRVLMQAWKRLLLNLRTHNWYVDTLGIDYQSLRIPGPAPFKLRNGLCRRIALGNRSLSLR